jgi:hypothetical protein
MRVALKEWNVSIGAGLNLFGKILTKRRPLPPAPLKPLRRLPVKLLNNPQRSESNPNLMTEFRSLI